MARAEGADHRPLIVFAHHGGDWIRGSEQCLLDLVEGLDRTRFRRLVLCNAPTLADAVERTGTAVVRADRWPRGALGAFLRRGSLLRCLQERGASLVHANTPRTLTVALPVARRLGIPVLSHLHLPFPSFGDFEQRLVQRTDAAVGVADNVVAALRRTPMPAERIRVIHNAVNEARLSQGDARALRASLGIPPGALVAASVGSLIRRKRHDVSIRALATARARGLDAHLLICGSGEKEAALRSFAGECGVGAAVHFLGYCAHPGAILRDAADVLVASAEEEAFGLNVIEAQAVGAPVVASDADGHRECLGPRAGILVPVGGAAALAEALIALADAPERRRSMGAAGRRFVRERFSMAAYVEAFTALYGELLAGPPADAGRGAWPPTVGPWIEATIERRVRRLRERLRGVARD